MSRYAANTTVSVERSRAEIEATLVRYGASSFMYGWDVRGAMIAFVVNVGEGPYLELFARRQRLGWDTWGNEALNHVEMGAA